MLKFFKTKILNLAYQESGPQKGYPVILLHGWPDNFHTWDKLTPQLNQAGFRTFAVCLRGFFPTRFLDQKTPRSGSFSAMAADILALAHGLKLKKFALIGHDWGARIAYSLSCIKGRPKISSEVNLSAGWQEGRRLSFKQSQSLWYQWLLGTKKGADLLFNHPQGLVKYLWQIWNPADFQISPNELSQVEKSFVNPDWARVSLHSYRVRWRFVQDDPRYKDFHQKIVFDPKINVPTLVIHGAKDTCNLPETSQGMENLFTGDIKQVVGTQVGHFPQRQEPKKVAQLAIDWINLHK